MHSLWIICYKGANGEDILATDKGFPTELMAQAYIKEVNFPKTFYPKYVYW